MHLSILVACMPTIFCIHVNTAIAWCDVILANKMVIQLKAEQM